MAPPTPKSALTGSGRLQPQADDDPLTLSVKEVFQRFDQSGDGVFDREELSKLLKTLLNDFDSSQISSLVAEIDKGGDGKISCREFVAWIKTGGSGSEDVKRSLARQTGAAREARIKEVFEKYDNSGDGSLDISELEKTLQNLGAFTRDEIKKICADLDKSKDGEVSYEEFSAWIKTASGEKEIVKAKAILAPSDSDGLEAIYYNFCGAGKADMDGKHFLLVLTESKLVDKTMPAATVDLVFSDTRVKPKGKRVVDFEQFETALELVAEKKGMTREEVRKTILETASRPSNSNSSQKLKRTFKKVLTLSKIMGAPADQPAAEAPQPEESKDAGAIEKEAKKDSFPKLRKIRRDDWKRDVDNSNLWRTFGLENMAGRNLKFLYAPPYVPEVLGSLTQPDSKGSIGTSRPSTSATRLSSRQSERMGRSSSLPQFRPSSSRSSPRGAQFVHSGRTAMVLMSAEMT